MNPFMVFIGPNNAGKSNIFDCLRFLSDFVKRGPESRRPVQERGGFELIVFNGDIGRTISLGLHGSINKERYYKYFIELDGDRWGNCLNKRETFSLVEDGEKVLLEFPKEQDKRVAYDETGKQTGKIFGLECNTFNQY
jgi:predicted ATPase